MSRKTIYSVIACLLFLLPTLSSAQSLTKYEYWFDNSFSSRTSGSLSGTDKVVKLGIATEHLDNGIHRFNFRAKQSDGKYSAISSSLFLKRTASQNSKLEYWIDGNIDQRESISISNTEEEQSLDLDLRDNTKYPMGFHKLYIRVTVEGEGESAIYSSPILKLSAGQASQLEYWIDDDIDNSKTLTGNATSDGDGFIYINQLDLRDVPIGLHRLNCRAVSNSRRTVSAVTSSNFFKLSGGQATQIEYWIDDDRSNIHTLSGTESSDHDGYIFINDLDLGNISPGHHRISFRATSNSGKTVSAVTTAHIMVKSKYNVENPEALTVTEQAYWIDDEEPKIFPVDKPRNVITQPYTFDTRKLTNGQHTLHVQYGNSAGIWNGPVDYPFTKTKVNDPMIVVNSNVEEGNVILKYNSLPFAQYYVVTRQYPNGTKRKVDVNYDTSHPAPLQAIDTPAPGTYTYYVEGFYTDPDGEIQSVRSGDVSVTVEKAAATIERGTITGVLLQNGERITSNYCKSRLYVNDEIIYNNLTSEGIFKISNVPYGTELNIRVEDSDWHYDDVTIIVSENTCNKTIYLNGTQGDDPEQLAIDAYDLTLWEGVYLTSDAIELKVYNKSKNPWSGNVIVKMINKADKDFWDQAMLEDFSVWYYLSHPHAGLQDIYLYKTVANMHVDLEGKGSKPLSMDIIDLPETNETEDYYVYVYSLKDGDEREKVLGGTEFPRVVTFNPFDCTLADEKSFKDYINDYKTIMTHLKMMSTWGDPFGLSIKAIKDYDKIVDNLGKGRYYDMEGLKKDLAYNGSQSAGMLLSCFLSDLNKAIKEHAKSLTTSLNVSDGIVEVYNTLDGFYRTHQVDDNHKFFETCKQVMKLCETLDLDKYLALNVYKTYFEVGDAMVSAIDDFANRLSLPFVCERLASGKGIYKIKIRKYYDGKNWKGYFDGKDFYPEKGSYRYHTGQIRSIEIKLLNPYLPNANSTSKSFDVDFEDDGIIIKNVKFTNPNLSETECEAWMTIIWNNNRVTHVPLLNENFVKIENLHKEVSTPLVMTVELQSETFLKENNANKITFVKQE